MNTKLTFLIVVLSLAMNASSQTVYNLQPNTRGNQIELTIANGAQATTAEQIEVKAIQYPQSITFGNAIQSVESLPPQGQRTLSFTFDVGRPSNISTNNTDTLKFLITDVSGTTWEKSIIIMYSMPSTFALEQNYPNPFNPSTTIRYQLPVDSKVALRVYDVLGREVLTLVDEAKTAGYYEEVLDATRLASGVYFYRLAAGNYIATKKLLVVK